MGIPEGPAVSEFHELLKDLLTFLQLNRLFRHPGPGALSDLHMVINAIYKPWRTLRCVVNIIHNYKLHQKN